MAVTKTSLIMHDQGLYERFVELPPQIIRDLEAHIERRLDQKLVEGIQRLWLRQSAEDFELRRYVCIRELLPKPSCALLMARLLACDPLHLTPDDLLERYNFCFPFGFHSLENDQKIDPAQAKELNSAIVDSGIISASLRTYGIRPERSATEEEAQAFMVRLRKRVQFLMEHQFPAVRRYFKSSYHVVVSKSKLSELFFADRCRNIVVLYQLCTRKGFPKELIQSLNASLSGSESSLHALQIAASLCVQDWEKNGLPYLEKKIPLVDFSNNLGVPETCALTMIPKEFIAALEARRENFYRLQVTNQHLFSLPRKIGSLAISVLDVSGNLFEELPQIIFEIKPLKYLFAKANLFTSISREDANRLCVLQGYAFDDDIEGVASDEEKEMKIAAYSTFDVDKDEIREYREFYRQKI